MLLTLSRAFLALTLSALLVYLVGAPLLVRHYGAPFVDAYLAPLALERLEGELSFNPLKLQLTVENLVLGRRTALSDPAQPAEQVGQVELITLDFFKRSLRLDKGWLQLDSAATALSNGNDAASGLHLEGWLQPLNALFLSTTGNNQHWHSELELPRAIFQATVQHLNFNDFDARLGDTGSVFRINDLTGSIIVEEDSAAEGRPAISAVPLHNWGIDARINEQPFQLSVRPQRTAGGAMFYIEIKDLQFAATDFSSSGLVLPPLPGIRDAVLLEGRVGMQGELVVEFEPDKRALTAIELQLGFTGLRGQGQYTDAAGTQRTLDVRTEQFSADIDQLQWLTDDQSWSPDRIRLQASSELVLTSLRFSPSPEISESFISIKSAMADILLDWQKGLLLEVHSEQFAIQALEAQLDDRILSLAEGVLELCGLPSDIAPARERFSINTSIEMSALTAFQDNCWFRQLILDGAKIAIEDGEPAGGLEPLLIRQHRLVVTEFSTESSVEPTAIEFTGLMANEDGITQTPVNAVVNLVDNTPELIRFSMDGYRPAQLNLLGDWLQRLTGLPISAGASGQNTNRKAITLEVGRLGDQYSGFAQIRSPPNEDVQLSRALSFEVTPYGELSEELWTPLLKTLMDMNSQP